MALSSLRRLLHRVASPIRSPHVLGTQPPLNRATMSIGRLPGHEDPTKWRRLPTQAPTATEMTESIADGLRGRPPWPVARGEEHAGNDGAFVSKKVWNFSHARRPRRPRPSRLVRGPKYAHPGLRGGGHAAELARGARKQARTPKCTQSGGRRPSRLRARSSQVLRSCVCSLIKKMAAQCSHEC